MRRRRFLLVALLLLPPFAGTLPGCAEVDGPARGTDGSTVEREERRGTEIVRNLGAEAPRIGLEAELSVGELDGPEHETFGMVTGLVEGPDGSFVLLDGPAARLHRYDADGQHLGSFGSRGSGPGEFQRPSSPVGLPGGRLALNDGAGGGISIFSWQGEFLERRRNPFATLSSLFVQDEGSVLGRFTVRASDRTDERRDALLRFPPEGGEVLDTLFAPVLDEDPAGEIYVTSGGRGLRARVPFFPRTLWTRHPAGYWVAGTGARYEILHLSDAGDTLRIVSREARRAPVLPEEGAERREPIETRARNVDPRWSWDAAPVPDSKPYFKGLQVGRDGSLWVYRHVEGEVLGEPGGAPRLSYTYGEPTVFDVFDEDGTFVGELRLEEGRWPLSRTLDRVWIREFDDLGVIRVVRYRVVLPQER